MKSRVATYCIIVLFCLPLAGCFKSEVALIDKSNAAWPFKRASILMILDNGERHAYNLESRTSSYGLTNLPEEDKKMKNGMIFFYEVKSDVFIMQWQGGDLDGRFDLFIVMRTGNEFTMDTCSGYKDETLSQLGIKRVLGECAITNLGQLVRLAQIPPDEQDRKFMAGEILLTEK